MGCFLACFGFKKKRKRRKSSSKIISDDQSCARYVPLDSDVAVRLDINEMPNAFSSKLSDEPKVSSSNVKIKKKVSFNLNVQTYEPIPNDEIDNYFSEGEEKTMWEFNQERAGTSMGMLEFEEDSIGSRFGSCHGNYRYQNCRNSYDEEDEIELEEGGLDEDDDDDLDSDGEDEDYDNQQLDSASMKLIENVTTAQLIEQRRCDHLQLEVSPIQEVNRAEPNQNVHSVLSPIENLTQWKAVKAKSRQQLKHQKENGVEEHEQHMHLNSKTLPNLNHSKPMMTRKIAVDASLSNWLV